MPTTNSGQNADAADGTGWNQRNQAIAKQLLSRVLAARPAPDGFNPNQLDPNGTTDIPRPSGAYTAALIAPGEWPEASESAISNYAKTVADWSRNHSEADQIATGQADRVFDGDWTAGEGREAAQQHYAALHRAHEDLVEAGEDVAARADQLSQDVHTAKRKMRNAHDAAHREIQRALMTNAGQPVGVGPIIAEYRPFIEHASIELLGYGHREAAGLTQRFGPPEAPPRKDPDSAQNDMPTDRPPKDDEPASKTAETSESPVGSSSHQDDLPTGRSEPSSDDLTPSGTLGNALPTPSATGSAPGLTGRQQFPSAPSMSPPSMGGGSGGGGSSPLSGLGSGAGSMQGMTGGAGSGLSGGGAGGSGGAGLSSPAAGASPLSSASPPSGGGEFGRGVAAGNAVAGGMPPVGSGGGSGIPQAPAGPAAAPLAQGSAPVSAAPATTTSPAAASAPPASTSGGGMGMPAGAAGSAAGGSSMTPYGSVLPPSTGAGAAAGAGSAMSSSAAPSAAAAGAAGTAAGAPGLLPGLRDTAPARVPRDVSMSDLEAVRAVVADLAAASSAVFPGLDWAVAAARGNSGVPDFWVCSNEGAAYLPAGVYLSRSMPLAAHFDPDFDVRWFGWFNPAERVIRAVRAMGYAVSAVATSWPTPSDFVDEATPDVAIGVTPSGRPDDAEAAELTRNRSHRLETLNAGLYRELVADEDAAEVYARYLIQHAVFDGPGLSTTAQAVARLVLGRQYPSAAQWDALQAEYTDAVLMAGSQRPGLMGVEEPHQLVTYRSEFELCRRVETLLCWRDENPADVAYAAAMAGIATPSVMAVVATGGRR